ncbi:MAG: glycoside hydrolase family 38 C-terminal domain-containing protein, partial [Spirochaetota bacterium]
EAQAAGYLGAPSFASSAEGRDDERCEAVVVNHLGRDRTSVLRISREEGESFADATQAVTDFDGTAVLLTRTRLRAASVTPLRDAVGAGATRALTDVPQRASSAAPEALLSVDGKGVTTPFYTVLFDEAGAIASLLDRATGAELATPGKPLNTLEIARDLPVNWDAWDIDSDYELTLKPVTSEARVETDSVGPLAAVFRRVLPVGEASRIEQDTILYAHTRRIDFRTRVDWRERHALLKASFPTTVRPPTARCGIQYGWVDRPAHRNRDADSAMFEVPAHGYIALADARRCVAVMAGDKYGYDVLDGRIRLSLLTAPTAPDETADNGVHEFTYAFLAAPQPFCAGTLLREAAELTTPPVIRQGWTGSESFPPDVNSPEARSAASPPGGAGAGNATRRTGETGMPTRDESSLVSVDEEQVQLDWIKPAEDGRGIIVRLFETEGAPAVATLRTAFPLEAVERTNLLEDPVAEPAQTGPLQLGPFEIATLRLVPRSSRDRWD